MEFGIKWKSRENHLSDVFKNIYIVPILRIEYEH